MNIDQNDMAAILEFLRSNFLEKQEPIIWNLGGGQKTQQIPIWDLFKERALQKGIPDKVCYTNQTDKGVLEIYEMVDGKLVSRKENIEVDLRLNEVFEIFGYDVKKDDLKRVYSVFGDYEESILLDDLFKIKEFRKYVTSLAFLNSRNHSVHYNKKNLEDIILKNYDMISSNIKMHFIGKSSIANDIELKIMSSLFGKRNRKDKKHGLILDLLYMENSDLKLKPTSRELINALAEKYGEAPEFIPQSFISKIDNESSKSSIYFERVLIKRVVELLKTKDHDIIEAYANVKTYKNAINIAEYDIACVTKRGTIIALDAKTFNSEKKDIDARLYNLEKGSGFYRDFIAVFPYNSTDLNEEWFRPLKYMPFDFSEKGIKFLIFNDNEPKSFSVFREKDNVLKINNEKKVDNGWVFCNNIDDFIS